MSKFIQVIPPNTREVSPDVVFILADADDPTTPIGVFASIGNRQNYTWWGKSFLMDTDYWVFFSSSSYSNLSWPKKMTLEYQAPTTSDPCKLQESTTVDVTQYKQQSFDNHVRGPLNAGVVTHSVAPAKPLVAFIQTLPDGTRSWFKTGATLQTTWNGPVISSNSTSWTLESCPPPTGDHAVIAATGTSI